jgi:hypothetical protein
MRRVGLCILLELSLRSKSWILDSIAIKMCSNTVGKWVGVGYGSDFWEAHCTTTFTEHPRWMGRLLRLDTNDTRLHKFNNSNIKTEFATPLPHHKPQVDERAHIMIATSHIMNKSFEFTRYRIRYILKVSPQREKLNEA